MASVTAVREALKARLDTIAGLTAYATAPGAPTMPAAVVFPAPEGFLVYDVAMSRGADDMRLVITLFVSRADDASGQAQLDAYLAGEGPSSVKATVEADQTIGGVAQAVSVTEARNYGSFNFNGVDYLGCELVVEVAV